MVGGSGVRGWAAAWRAAAAGPWGPPRSPRGAGDRPHRGDFRRAAGVLKGVSAERLSEVMTDPKGPAHVVVEPYALRQLNKGIVGKPLCRGFLIKKVFSLRREDLAAAARQLLPQTAGRPARSFGKLPAGCRQAAGRLPAA